MASKASKIQKSSHTALKIKNYMQLTLKICKNLRFFAFFSSTRKYEVRVRGTRPKMGLVRVRVRVREKKLGKYEYEYEYEEKIRHVRKYEYEY